MSFGTARNLFALGYAAAVLVALAWAGHQPAGFQKAYSIGPADGFAPIAEERSIDVAELIGDIPYDGGFVWEIDPKAKYEATIVEGRGNCANLVQGLAYSLIQSGVDFQVIGILPEGFLDGDGHTVVRTRYTDADQERTGLVDVLAGALPRSGDRFLDVADLRAGAIPDFGMTILNDRKDGTSGYYGDFVEGSLISYMPAAEIARYHRFLGWAYLPLGVPKVEKFLYDGVAVVLGYYPKRFLPDYDQLTPEQQTAISRHRMALWTLRSVPLALLVFAGLFLLPRRGR